MEKKENNSKLEAVATIIKASMWPVTILIFYILFSGDLHKCLAVVPTLLSNSKTISISGLKIEVNEKLKIEATRPVKEILKRMSPDGIDKILELSPTSSQLLKESELTDSVRNRYYELYRLNLVTKSPITLTPEGNNIELQLNDKGKDVRKFLVSLIGDLVDR